MLVFRCECEQVLGVEDESNKGGLGECPTCGRIIRVPQALVSAAGRLRLAGTPSRATSSGAYREVKDPVTNGSGTVTPGPSPKESLNARPLAAAPEIVAAAEVPSPASLLETRTAEPETLAPISAPIPAPAKEPTPEMGVQISETPDAGMALDNTILPDAPTEMTVAALTPEAAAEAAAASAPATASATTKAAPGSARKPGLVRRPIRGQKSAAAKKDANDPSAAVETKNDRNLAAVANAAASRRKKADAAPAAPAKKSYMLIYMLAMVAVLAAGGVLYAMGFFNTEPKKTNTVPASTAVPVKKETKPDTSPEPKTAPEPDTKADPVKPPDQPDPKAPADPDKKDPAPAKTEDKKDPAAPAKTEDKKDPAAEKKTDDKKDEKKDN